MKKSLFPIMLATLALTACSKTLPTCSDIETTELVIQIAQSEMINQLGPVEAQVFSYDVGAIRTTFTNEQTGAYDCAAQLEITVKGTDQSTELPITYTVEMLDNKKEFYVNVYGL